MRPSGVYGFFICSDFWTGQTGTVAKKKIGSNNLNAV